MLSKSDKQFIRNVIKEEVIEALTVEWQIEKVRDEKTGQPLAVKELIKEEVFIPSIFIQMMPYLEGAMRGVQADISKNNNKINGMTSQVESIGNILLQTEDSLRLLASLSDYLKQVGFNNNNNNSPKQIDVNEVIDVQSDS